MDSVVLLMKVDVKDEHSMTTEHSKTNTLLFSGTHATQALDENGGILHADYIFSSNLIPPESENHG